MVFFKVLNLRYYYLSKVAYAIEKKLYQLFDRADLAIFPPKVEGLDLLEVQAFLWELNRTIGDWGLSKRARLPSEVAQLLLAFLFGLPVPFSAFLKGVAVKGSKRIRPVNIRGSAPPVS